MAKFGTLTIECPVCRGPWDVHISGKMSPRRGKPGEAVTTVTVKKPIRIPRQHKNCIGKVS